MTVHESIIGSWKSNDRDFVITFEPDNKMFINSGALAGQKLFYSIKHNAGLNKWQLTAPEIGLHISFIKSISESEMVIENSGDPGSTLLINDAGEFIDGVDIITFIRVV